MLLWAIVIVNTKSVGRCWYSEMEFLRYGGQIQIQMKNPTDCGNVISYPGLLWLRAGQFTAFSSIWNLCHSFSLSCLLFYSILLLCSAKTRQNLYFFFFSNFSDCLHLFQFPRKMTVPTAELSKAEQSRADWDVDGQIDRLTDQGRKQ